MSEIKVTVKTKISNFGKKACHKNKEINTS